jgi:antitoxin VapB
MSINIKRPETVELVRKLAELRGEGLTQTIHEVLSAAYERAATDAAKLEAATKAERLAKMLASVAEIQARVSKYKIIDPRPWKEILYDEDGLPQ